MIDVIPRITTAQQFRYEASNSPFDFALLIILRDYMFYVLFCPSQIVVSDSVT